MKEVSVTPESITRPPFEIRGHHVVSGPFGYSEGLFLQPHVNPERILEYTEDHVKEMTRDRQSHYKNVVEYVHDLMGTGMMQKYEYFRRNLRGITAFHELSDDDVVLITQEPDEVCKMCIKGAHCHDPEISDEDAKVISSIEEYFRERGLKLESDYRFEVSPTGRIRLATTKKIYLEMLSYFKDKQLDDQDVF